MFVRKLNHPNGKVYVQVVDKRSGKYQVLRSFGGTSDEKSLQLSVRKAEHWIQAKTGLQKFNFSGADAYVEQFFNSISSIERAGYDLLLGPIFAYKVYKELERQLKEMKATISGRRCHRNSGLHSSNYRSTTSKWQNCQKTLLLTDEQRYLAELFNFGC